MQDETENLEVEERPDDELPDAEWPDPDQDWPTEDTDLTEGQEGDTFGEPPLQDDGTTDDDDPFSADSVEWGEDEDDSQLSNGDPQESVWHNDPKDLDCADPGTELLYALSSVTKTKWDGVGDVLDADNVLEDCTCCDEAGTPTAGTVDIDIWVDSAKRPQLVTSTTIIGYISDGVNNKAVLSPVKVCYLS